MPIPLLMPALSPTMTEGNLVKWLKQEGDKVNPGDIIAEIETDKATMEVEAVDEGILGKILIKAGTEAVKVNQTIAFILEEGETLSSIPEAQHLVVNPASVEQTPSKPQVTSPKSSSQIKDPKLFATPLAKKIAQEKSIDLNQIVGSGPNGRIIKIDLEKTSQNFTDTKTSSVDIPLNNIRKVIAKRLTEAKQTIPHFYLTIDCNLDELMELRQKLNLYATSKLSVNDFIIKAIALALITVPEANITFHDTFVRQYQSVDVAVAVAIDGGLVTPIIKDVSNKSVTQLSLEMKTLAEKAKAGKLTPEEYQGGSFTLSNLGMYGIKNFDAIINPPQACILAVGQGEQRPIVKDGQVKVATIMTCTLSIDHRALDGAVGSKFLQHFKGLLEEPLRLLI